MKSSGFGQAVSEFNQQEFYACHDTLEALWMDSTEPYKSFYQGVLQIAVGCYHLAHHNWRGAVILLGEGIGKLRDYQPDYEGIDVEQLLSDSFALLQGLHQIHPQQLGEWLSRQDEETPLPWPKIVRINSE